MPSPNYGLGCPYLGEPTGERASSLDHGERPVPVYRCRLLGTCTPTGNARANIPDCKSCKFNPSNGEGVPSLA